MLKTDIIQKAKSLEMHADTFVRSNQQLLIAENNRENSILEAAGMNEAHNERLRLEHENTTRRSLNTKTGSYAVLTLDEIKSLCIRYRLRFLKSNRYAGVIDEMAGKKMMEFLNKNGDPNAEASARERFFIMASADSFKLNSRPVSATLFYRHENGLFSMVHKWGDDLTVFRRIVGLFTSSALIWRWSIFLGIIALGPLSAFFLGLADIKDPHGFIFCAGIPIALLRLIALAENDEGRYTFSDRAWDTEKRSERKWLIFM